MLHQKQFVLFLTVYVKWVGFSCATLYNKTYDMSLTTNMFIDPLTNSSIIMYVSMRRISLERVLRGVTVTSDCSVSAGIVSGVIDGRNMEVWGRSKESSSG